MNILITGGAGYIGSILSPFLLEKGHHVTVVDNYMYQQNTLIEFCYQKNFTLINGDVRNKSLISEVIKDKDFIIPLAALVGAPLCNKDEHNTTAINRDSIVMLDALRSKNQGIIYPTTNSGYGIGEKNIFCNEQTPLKPISLYGKTKVEAEQTLLSSGNVVTFRFATIFGFSPRMRLDLLVNDFTYRAYKDKYLVLFESHFKRNFLHIRDAANAFLFAIENFDRMKNEPYNVGLSSANLSKLELSNKIREQIPDLFIIESDVNHDPDQRNYIVSNEKIEKLGFSCMFSIEDGIRELIKGFTVLNNSKYGNA